MGILNRLKRFFIGNDLSVTDEKAWNPSLWNLIGAQSNAGLNVTEHTALTYSAVYCAVSLISGTIATLPLRLIKEKDRKKQGATHKSIYHVLHTKANPYMTAMTLREVLTAHALTWGNGYAEVVRNSMGDVVEMWPITPNRVTPRMRDSELVYEITVDGELVILPRSQILHIPGMGFAGFLG